MSVSVEVKITFKKFRIFHLTTQTCTKLMICVKADSCPMCCTQNHICK